MSIKVSSPPIIGRNINAGQGATIGKKRLSTVTEVENNLRLRTTGSAIFPCQSQLGKLIGGKTRLDMKKLRGKWAAGRKRIEKSIEM